MFTMIKLVSLEKFMMMNWCNRWNQKIYGLPTAYDLEFFRVDEPTEPALDPNDLYSIIPMNQKKIYNIYDVIGRFI